MSAAVARAHRAEMLELEDAMIEDDESGSREVLWLSDEWLDLGIVRIENWLKEIQP